MKVTVQGSLQIAGLITIVGGGVTGGLLALGFRMETPAAIEASHVEEFHDHTTDFEGHVAHFEEFQDAYTANEATKDVSRATRTQMVEAQSKLTCLRTGADTLVMLDMIDICDDLGVPRR